MKKIMFNDKYGLTQAVLKGRKTQTRRLLKHQPSSEDSEMLFYIFDDERYYDNPEKDPLWGSVSWKNSDGTKTEINKVAYLIGEEVAVAQSYKERFNGAELPFVKDTAGWSNKMFVKASLMSERIKITNVRVERLQDISDEDCLAEGIYAVILDNENGRGIQAYTFGEFDEHRCYNTPRVAYANLIDKVSGKGTWKSNPWVFVYDFELVR